MDSEEKVRYTLPEVLRQLRAKMSSWTLTLYIDRPVSATNRSLSGRKNTAFGDYPIDTGRLYKAIGLAHCSNAGGKHGRINPWETFSAENTPAEKITHKRKHEAKKQTAINR